jgi:hypothetical protein
MKKKKKKSKQNKTTQLEQFHNQNIAKKKSQNIYILHTQIHDHSLLETDTSIKRGELNLVLKAKTKIKYKIYSWNKMIHNVLLFIYNDIIQNPNNYFLVSYLI